MSAWLLLGWLALYPSERFGVSTFTTREDCEARAMWLAEPSRKRALRREYACVEVPAAACSEAQP